MFHYLYQYTLSVTIIVSCLSVGLMVISEHIVEKYEEAHRSQDGMGIKTLDFYVKKKTDHYNNLINT